MNSQNLVSGSLTAEQKTAIDGAVRTILTNLPFAVDLTPQQRHDLVKAGDKSVAFISRCRDMAAQNPAWLPPTFAKDEFMNDVALFEALAPLIAVFTQLLEKTTDTRMAAGSDAMVGALIFYGIAKAAGQGSNLDDLIAAMGGRFARTSKAKTTTAAKTTA